jgi:hypothetical protein
VLIIPALEEAGTGRLTADERTVGPDGEVLLVFPTDSAAVRAATHAQDDEPAAVLEVRNPWRACDDSYGTSRRCRQRPDTSSIRTPLRLAMHRIRRRTLIHHGSRDNP